MTKDNIFMNTDVLNVSNNNSEFHSSGIYDKKIINISFDYPPFYIFVYEFPSFPYKCNKDCNEINCILNNSHGK